LGGLKISDAFGMMHAVLNNGIADLVLTTGVTGLIMLMAQGKPIGPESEKFIRDRSLDKFIAPAGEYLEQFPDKLLFPQDLAVEINGCRQELLVAELPAQSLIIDIGEQTIAVYEKVLKQAGTVFVNGPAGVYETKSGEKGTRRLWEALAATKAFTVIGGGDTVTSATRFIDTDKLGFVCTGGGALIRYMSGTKLPLIEAMEKTKK
jgi:phosphoglycerate kinase